MALRRPDSGQLLLGLPLVVLGLFEALHMARRATLDCARTNGQITCELVVGRPLGERSTSLGPGSVQGVKLEERTSEDGNGVPQYWSRVVLVSTQGDVPVTDWGDGGSRETQGAIAAFLDDPARSTLHEGHDSRWMHGILGTLWVLGGLFLALRR